jgi:O6-methylguanine-DNA--protein-cysteine methyltransferase
MTPGQYRRGGQNLTLAYTLADCFLGRLLVAATPRGIAAVRLGDDDATLLAGLAQEFSAAELRRDAAGLAVWVAAILGHLEGHPVRLDLPIDVRATAFQRRVWQALRDIPYGATRTYGQVAAAIGQPRAARAVGSACAANPWPWWCPPSGGARRWPGRQLSLGAGAQAGLAGPRGPGGRRTGRSRCSDAGRGLNAQWGERAAGAELPPRGSWRKLGPLGSCSY